MALFRTLLKDRRASISIASAIAMTMLIGAVALAVDVGSFYLDRRKLQGIADAAALAAAGRPGQERAAAERIIAANCACNIVIASLVPGTYRPDPAVQAEQRFSPGGTGAMLWYIRMGMGMAAHRVCATFAPAFGKLCPDSCR